MAECKRIPAALTLIDLLDSKLAYPIYDTFCSNLGVKDIISLTRTCKKLSGLYQALLRTQWNIDHHLRRFANDPRAFRSQMGRCDAVASGSLPLQLFERTYWKGSDLDIWVPIGEDTERFTTYLTEKEGYTFSSKKKSRNYEIFGIVMCLTYTNSQDAQIQIVVCRSLPLKSILEGFYSTIIINFFTANKAYALFPYSTFVHHRGYLLECINEHVQTLLFKYDQRGYKFQYVMSTAEEEEYHPMHRERRIGDRFTWVIPFDNDGVEKSRTPDFTIEYGMFTVHKKAHDSPLHTHYEIEAPCYRAYLLRYGYMCCSKRSSWLAFLKSKVSRLTASARWELKQVDWPRGTDVVQFSRTQQEDLALFEVPKDWPYCDAQVPQWFETWSTLQNLKYDPNAELPGCTRFPTELL